MKNTVYFLGITRAFSSTEVGFELRKHLNSFHPSFIFVGEGLQVLVQATYQLDK